MVLYRFKYMESVHCGIWAFHDHLLAIQKVPCQLFQHFIRFSIKILLVTATRSLLQSSDKMWSTEGWNRKPLQYSCCENSMDSMKRQIYDTRRWAPRSGGVQYATGEEHRAITNSSRKNEEDGPEQKQHSVVDMSGGESKVQCHREKYCIET